MKECNFNYKPPSVVFPTFPAASRSDTHIDTFRHGNAKLSPNMSPLLSTNNGSPASCLAVRSEASYADAACCNASS